VLTPAWQDFRRREVGCFAALVLAVGMVAVAGLSPPEVADVAGWLAVAFIVLAIAAAIWSGSFRCPRCGHTYSVRVGPGRFPDRKPSGRNCLHCWLPKWADPDRVPEEVVDENDDW
jgi:hypothetical protein